MQYKQMIGRILALCYFKIFLICNLISISAMLNEKFTYLLSFHHMSLGFFSFLKVALRTELLSNACEYYWKILYEYKLYFGL